MKYVIALSLSLILISCSPDTPNTSNNPTPGGTSSSTQTSTQPTDSNPPNTTPDTSIPASSGFRYLGITQDLAPAAVAGTADGKPDHSFELTHRFASEVTVKAVTISRIENGSPNGVAGWSTSPARQYWILKAQADGNDLNANSKVLNLDKKVSNDVRFVFFGSDLESLKLSDPGTEYELILTYSDASGADQTLTQRVKL